MNSQSGIAVPLEIRQSWPLTEQPRRFELGLVLNSVIADAIEPARIGALGVHHAGCWECDLADSTLTWSGGVYDIFGLERGVMVGRDDAVRFYAEESRAKMERLRAHAIRHHRGFTLDVEIRAASGEARWMRLIAAPRQDGGRSVLHGLKLIV